MTTCATCGTPASAGASVCSTCGSALSAISLSKKPEPAAPPQLPAASGVSLGKPAADGPRPELLADLPSGSPNVIVPPYDPEPKNRKGLYLVAAAAVLLLLVVGSVIGVLAQDDGDPGTETASAGTSATTSPDSGTGLSSDPTDDQVADPTVEPSDDATVAGAGGATTARAQLEDAVAADADRAQDMSGIWTAQLASSSSREPDEEFLVRYQELSERYPDALLIFSGDWPGSFGPSSSASWVVLNSGIADETTRPVLDWCAAEGWANGQCWAKRLAQSGDDPLLNTDRAPADERNNGGA